MDKKNIVILGGGYAGVKAGKTLHKLNKKHGNLNITLIDKHPFHTLMTELHEVAGHRTDPSAIRVDLRKVFAGRTVNVVTDSINHIDFEQQVLTSDKTTYAYDYLVVATGNESNFFGVEGAEDNAHTLWSYEDAVNLRGHIRNMFEKASVEPLADERKKLLTFAVCGSGFTGVEMAGEIGEAKKHLSVEYGIDEKEVSIYNIEALGRILNTLKSDAQIRKVEKRYKKLGVELLLESPITKIAADSITLGDGTIIPTYTLIWTAGIKNTQFGESLGLKSGRANRMSTNCYMQSLDYENVFIAGDAVAYQDEEYGPLPQIVEAAEQSGHTAAENIFSLIESTSMHKHKQNYHGFMVSVGSRYAVADTGFKTSGWIAMLIKHFVNFFYLFMVGGLRQFWNYLRHEFFHVKNRRSFVGGHFSKASPNFWLVPLRLWLGVMWLVEGVKKIDEGWLKEPKMYASTPTTDGVTQSSETAEAVVDTVAAASQTAEPVVDTVAAASQAAEPVVDAAGQVVEHVSTLPWFADWITSHSPSGYGKAIFSEVPDFMQWMIDTIVAPNAVPIQTVMVVLEILIGLALLAGLFTFLASIVSVGMVVGISLTGMADATILWFFFGGIALIAGAGSTFGLDYYVLPPIKRWWSKTKFAKKSYLYFD